MNTPSPSAWWREVTAYQWLILAIASAGWVFDVYQGQVFNLTRGRMLADILGASATPGTIARWGEFFLGIFLVGGTLGGIFFGWLGDRLGRKPVMILTILVYSIFSGLTCLATGLWQVGALRFCVALGVGGEWAVAAALIAEVFSPNARAHAGGIFHATSVLGTWLAALAGMMVGTHWRLAYLFGVLPALLVLWVLVSLKEPESWRAAQRQAAAGESVPMGSFRDLLLNPRWASRAILGVLLAGVGLGSFWGVTVAGQDLVQLMLVNSGVPAAVATGKAQFAYGIIQSAGGGLGLLSFGPLCVRIGRRGAFIAFQCAALVIVPATCYLPHSYGALLLMLPVFGFLTLGMQAGYAIYFPELFPTHLRSTGTAFCFNGGRFMAAFVLLFSGWLKSRPGMDLRLAVTLLGGIFAVGIVVALFLPETRNQPLPA